MRLLGQRLQTGFVRPAPGPAGKQQAPARQEQAQPAGPWRTAVLNTLVALVGGVGLALIAYAAAYSPDAIDWKLLLTLTALAVLAERTDFSMYGSSRVSLAFVPIFAAVLAFGITGLAVVVPVAVLASAWGRKLHKTIFNFGTLMVAGAAAELVLRAIPGVDYGNDWPRVILPATVAGGVNFLVNSALVATAISLSTRTSLKAVWQENFLWLTPHYIILAGIGLAIVSAYSAMGIWGVAVFVAPPLMMRLSIKQYLERTTKNVLEVREAHLQLQQAHDQLTYAMTSLGQAYDGTLRSLVAALDARDSETAGHSERVADLTMAIATEMGIPRETEDWKYITWGALLHDVGKIAVPDHILRKPGALTSEEWVAMRGHPRAGHDILQSVDFLTPASEIVLAHHERYDGQGYPRGLAGEEIPLGARIFMIADAFDAMTSDRTYRRAMPAEEALAEVLRNSGTQFDPAAVRAFLSVYQKRFVGTVHHKHLSAASLTRGSKLELSESLKQAIAEAAGLDD